MSRMIRRIVGYSLFVVGIVSGFSALLMTPLYISGGPESEGPSGETLLVIGVVHWLLTLVLVGLGVFLASGVRANDKVPGPGLKRLLGVFLLLASLFPGYLVFLVLIDVSVRGPADLLQHWHFPAAFALWTLLFVVGGVRCLRKGRPRPPPGEPR